MEKQSQRKIVQFKPTWIKLHKVKNITMAKLTIHSVFTHWTLPKINFIHLAFSLWVLSWLIIHFTTNCWNDSCVGARWFYKRGVDILKSFSTSDNVDFYHYLSYILLTKSISLELLTHLILTFTLLLWINTIWVTLI